MSNTIQRHRLLRRFGKNEDGNMAMTFALTVTMMAGLVGAAIDFSTLSNAHSRSQSIADAAALNAAIFVKNNDRLPKNNQEGYMDGVTYTAAELGYNFKGWVEGGSENVTVKVDYNDTDKEATVTVKGNTIPTFMQVMGRDKMPFSTQSVVSYYEAGEKFPASITLVLDNSGSMAWDDRFANADGTSPDLAKARIDGLKIGGKNFVNRLKSRLGDQTTANGQRFLRMGMIPYSSDVITTAQQNMGWGYVTHGKLNSMLPSGSTNSNPPMAQAKSWMDLEDAFHQSEATRVGEDYVEPMKFVIFMTDGQNTSGNYEVVPGDTGYWYGQVNGRWYYSTGPYRDFVEGTLTLDSDRLTIESCQQMKDDGVEIFTIGYALEVGHYNANEPSNNKKTEYVSEGMRSTAYSLLSSCASKPENHITANHGVALNQAFDVIQNAIVEELIRIKS